MKTKVFLRHTPKLILIVSIFSSTIILFISFFSNGFSDSILELLAPLWNREFGIIEMLQNIVILCILIGLIYIRTNPAIFKFDKKYNLILILGIVYLLLEENDYFLHYYDRIIYGKEIYKTTFQSLRNVHNSHFALTRINALISFISLIVVFGLAIYNFVLHKKKVRNHILCIIIVLIILIPLISIFTNYMYIENRRQIRSETMELSLYTSWMIFLFNWMRLKNLSRI